MKKYLLWKGDLLKTAPAVLNFLECSHTNPAKIHNRIIWIAGSLIPLYIEALHSLNMYTPSDSFHFLKELINKGVAFFNGIDVLCSGSI